jgi:hypothetical protein
MNDRIGIDVGGFAGEEQFKEILKKVFRDFDDYLFGKTDVRCLERACLISGGGKIFATARFFEPCVAIDKQVSFLAEHGRERWGDGVILASIDLKYEYIQAPLVLRGFDAGKQIICGLGFCIDSPYGNEGLDVLSTVLLRAEKDYYLWWQEQK